MKKSHLITFILSALFLSATSYAQVSKARTQPQSFSIGKKIILPPKLECTNLKFQESDGNKRLDAGETATISFDVLNKGKGTANSLTMTVKEKNSITGIDAIYEKDIQSISPKGTHHVSIKLSANMQLKTGEAYYEIDIMEANGFNLTVNPVAFDCLEFKTPNIQIVANEFSLPEGEILKLGEQFTLTILVQNTGQGDADDVFLGFDFVPSIYPITDYEFNIKKLKSGEKREFTTNFITNSEHKGNEILIKYVLNESYDKYGEESTLITHLDTRLETTQALRIEGDKFNEKKIEIGLLGSIVDQNIPTNSKVNNRFALVIGNEDYKSKQSTLSSEQNVDYAVNDASTFKKYCLKTLGVKEENMFFLTNATAGTMHQEIDLITKIINKVGRKAELIVYYAGHGYPDELTKVPYLIPVDVSASNLSTAIKLDDLYQKLANTNASKITIFLDACFTGGGRNSGLVASRGVKVKPKEGVLDGNIVVFSASSAEESSLPYHDEGHGVFTYFLLKKFQESEGNVTLGELLEYLDENVSIKSLRVNQKEQNPTVNTSQKVINDWRNWKF